MDIETRKELERELAERNEKMKLLDWMTFLNELKTKLSPNDLSKLHVGFDKIELEGKLEGYKQGKKDVVAFLDNKINGINKILKEQKNMPDSSYSFLDKLARNLENIKLEILKE